MHKVTDSLIISQDTNIIDKMVVYYKERLIHLSRDQYICNYNIDMYQQAQADRNKPNVCIFL